MFLFIKVYSVIMKKLKAYCCEVAVTDVKWMEADLAVGESNILLVRQ